ncbi:MAG TPA: DNA-binding protein, partial [Chloroflexi bacterium]|nr:DNA-binding protein [Chloroflexota bacterium]
RSFLIRLPYGEDLLLTLKRFCEENGITQGVLAVIGAVRRATVGYYDQEAHEYKANSFDQPMEIVSCIGNISLLEGEPFVHAHIVLADKEGRPAAAGHLMEGAIIFAGEAFVQELIGEPLVREFDEQTSLSLWPWLSKG